jgi:putative nucleotidyltransferase with HDIG domain
MEKEKVLIIDDEEYILNLSRDILTKSRYMVRTALNGNEGIKLFEKEPFDLILTDIKMPKIDGLDVIRHVRTVNKEIPIIVITGNGTLDIAISSLRLGAQGFILKPFTPAELRASIADALEKTRLLSENIRMRALMPLFEVSKEIIGEVDPERLLKLIVDFALREAKADKVCLALIDEITEKLQVKEYHNLSADFIRDFEKTYGIDIARYILENKRPFLIGPDILLPDEFEEFRKSENILSGVCVRLAVRGNIIGFFFIGRTIGEQPFTPSEVELVSVLSDHAAAAIDNARLYEKLERSYLSTIVTLSGVVEARDLYTDKHMKDIAEYSVEIAKKLDLSEKDIENIRKAALLHDLGKVSVPDNILMKEGKLTADEMEIIKKHPTTGARMIEPVEHLKQAREIIKHHQECYDGSGYPDGLKGDNIPLGARIVAVADAFGAMTTTRPYRKALSVDQAKAELGKYSGIQFDPDIVEIFFAILKERSTSGDI